MIALAIDTIGGVEMMSVAVSPEIVHVVELLRRDYDVSIAFDTGIAIDVNA